MAKRKDIVVPGLVIFLLLGGLVITSQVVVHPTSQPFLAIALTSVFAPWLGLIVYSIGIRENWKRPALAGAWVGYYAFLEGMVISIAASLNPAQQPAQALVLTIIFAILGAALTWYLRKSEFLV